MREETQGPYPICVYCHQPILPEERPFRTNPDGTQAHLKCWTDHLLVENERDEGSKGPGTS